jgi:hypothetical protein
VIKANATTLLTCETVVGVSIETKSAGANVKIRTFGEATTTTDGTNFDVGKRVYVGTTAGQGSKSIPIVGGSAVYLVGNATATNKVMVNPNLEYVIEVMLIEELGAGEEAEIGAGEEGVSPAI